MRQQLFLSAILALVLALPAHGAGIFNGSTSDVSVTVSSTAPSYPILMSCWFRPNNATHNGTLIAFSDNAAGGSLDSLVLAARGDISGDPLYAQATAAGAASQSATSSGFTLLIDQYGNPIPEWFLAIGYFTSTSSRQAVLNRNTLTHTPTWSTAETTTRAVGNYTRVSIGSLWNGGTSAMFNGQIARAAVWIGVDADLVDVGVRQITSGLPPSDARSVIRSSLAYYQPLVSAINGNSVGAAMASSDLTFDTDQQPPTGSSVGFQFPGSQESIEFRWPITSPTVGPFPFGRMVKLVDGFLQLADAADDNAVGATGPHGSSAYFSGYQKLYRITGPFLRVEVAAGDSIDQGAVVYQADDGYGASTGTKRLGVAYEAGTAGDLIRVLPSWTQ